MATIQGLVIPADDEAAAYVREFPADDLGCLQAAQALVGGYVEAVVLADVGAAVWMDEDGKSRGRPNNVRASKLLAPVLAVTDFVVGDVLVFGVTADGGNADVPLALLDSVL